MNSGGGWKTYAILIQNTKISTKPSLGLRHESDFQSWKIIPKRKRSIKFMMRATPNQALQASKDKIYNDPVSWIILCRAISMTHHPWLQLLGRKRKEANKKAWHFIHVGWGASGMEAIDKAFIYGIITIDFGSLYKLYANSITKIIPFSVQFLWGWSRTHFIIPSSDMLIHLFLFKAFTNH